MQERPMKRCLVFIPLSPFLCLQKNATDRQRNGDRGIKHSAIGSKQVPGVAELVRVFRPQKSHDFCYARLAGVFRAAWLVIDDELFGVDERPEDVAHAAKFVVGRIDIGHRPGQFSLARQTA